MPDTPSSTRPPFPYLPVLLVALGHFAHDVFTAFYGVLLPILAPALGLNRTTAGLVTFARHLPALLNPVLGYAADRISVRWFVILAPGLTATGMTWLGWVPNASTLALLLFLVGVSTAMFHAPAPALVAQISHPYTGRGMSFFMAAGELGRAIGPVLAVWAVTVLTLERLPTLALLGWLATGILAWRLAGVEARAQRNHNQVVASGGFVLRWLLRLGLPLALLILGRAFIVGGLGTYLAWYLTDQGYTLVQAGRWVAVYEFTGMVGALLSGTMSDFLGRRRTVALTTALAALFTAAFVLSPTPWKPVWLPLLGLSALSIQPVMLALIQDLAPNHRAAANGIYLAMSFLLRPVGVTSLGYMADFWGQWELAFLTGATLALLSLPLLHFLHLTPTKQATPAT